jgi:ABC-type transport system involved in cytochrome c biogenesis ATPase subunit
MLTKLTIDNFKRFDHVEIDLGSAVVLIGPNNSGKTSALQALALWEVGLKKWNEKRAVRETPKKRPGVTINRNDLIAVPLPDANLLWRDLHVRDVHQNGGKPQTKNIRIDICVEGVTKDKAWACGFEFDYANTESFYCRPLRQNEDKNPPRMAVPDEASTVHIAFLPPMSGLASEERRLDPGAIKVLIGEGRTAEVLRNLAFRVVSESGAWERLESRMRDLFGVSLDKPVYVPERGEIRMTYRDQAGTRLDLSSSGRGLQQTLLLLAYLEANPGAVLLLDEPDAHLEILRQRQIYQLLTDVARKNGSQIIAASHSEIILNEAADRDVVVAFVGKPHRIDDRGSQLMKSLKEIGFEQYYQAEQKGWVFYLEGATDLAILRAFAETLEHPALKALERPFVHYVQNQPNKALQHFHGLREAKGDLIGIALFDRLERKMDSGPGLEMVTWRRREVENYLCFEEVLMLYAEQSARDDAPGPLFSDAHVEERRQAMRESVSEVAKAMEVLQKGSPWSPDTKVSDDFLDPLFEAYFKRLKLPNLMRKTDYHVIASLVPRKLIDPECIEVLDQIDLVAKKAHPIV